MEFFCFLKLNNIVCICHILFIHSSVDRRLDCFHLLVELWIMLLWTWVHKCLFKFLLFSLLCIYPEVESPGHMVILCLVFWGIAIIFSIIAALFYIPANNGQGLQFLHIPANSFCFPLFLFVFYNIYPNGYKMISHCDFDGSVGFFLQICWSSFILKILAVFITNMFPIYCLSFNFACNV